MAALGGGTGRGIRLKSLIKRFNPLNTILMLIGRNLRVRRVVFNSRMNYNRIMKKLLLFSMLYFGFTSISYSDDAWDAYIANERSSCGMLAYEDGNYQRAFKKYMICAKEGDEFAQYMIGIMYKNGQGVNQDYKKAYSWVSQSANQGYYFAQHKLSEFYELGIGVLKDDKLVFSWNLEAAKQGHALSQYNLAQNYRVGQGVLKNYKKAVTWYKKAAEQESTIAQTALGVMYVNGDGVLSHKSQCAHAACLRPGQSMWQG